MPLPHFYGNVVATYNKVEAQHANIHFPIQSASKQKHEPEAALSLSSLERT